MATSFSPNHALLKEVVSPALNTSVVDILEPPNILKQPLFNVGAIPKYTKVRRQEAFDIVRCEQSNSQLFAESKSDNNFSDKDNNEYTRNNTPRYHGPGPLPTQAAFYNNSIEREHLQNDLRLPSTKSHNYTLTNQSQSRDSNYYQKI